jgi:hypothetical protein
VNSVLIYTVHKAASTFLDRLTQQVAADLGVRHYSISDERYFDRIRTVSWKSFIEGANRGGCFGPIRGGAAEPCLPEDISPYRVILHLRDPRDVLTSMFFSHVYSHARREGRFNPSDDQRRAWEEEGIDAFVLKKAAMIRERYEILCAGLLGSVSTRAPQVSDGGRMPEEPASCHAPAEPTLASPPVNELCKRDNVILVKYETLVTDFGMWLHDYLSAFARIAQGRRRLLGLIPRRPHLGKLHEKYFELFRNEFATQGENIRQHKRQVTPGDHRRKLSAATIEELNREFADVLAVLDYQDHSCTGADAA